MYKLSRKFFNKNRWTYSIQIFNVAIWAFDNIENKPSFKLQGRLCKKVLFSLKRTSIINFEKKKMLPLIKKELKLHQDVIAYYICWKWFPKTFTKDGNYQKASKHYHFTGKHSIAAHSICNVRFNVPNEIPVVFHNGSN